MENINTKVSILYLMQNGVQQSVNLKIETSWINVY